MDKYNFLFPFEKIKQGSRIIIYGAGDVGCDYLEQLLITKYCTCVAVLDRNAANIAPLIVPVYTPDYLPKLTYDYIVLAFKDGCHLQAVTNTLLHYGAEKNKIVFQSVRPQVNILAPRNEDRKVYSYAFGMQGISIGIKMGPSLGDAIIKKKIIMELAAMAPDSKIDIYAAGSSKFMGAIYDEETPGLNELIDDGGVLFEYNKGKYDVALELYSILSVKHISRDLAGKNKNFYDKMQSLDAAMKKYNLPVIPITNVHIHFRRMLRKGLNAYNYLNFTGVFDIRDKDAAIKLNEAYSTAYQKMALGRYITINYGTANTAVYGEGVIAKQWPFTKLEQFVRNFKAKYPQINVVQLGTKNAAKVSGVDRYVLGQSLELVKYVLNGSLLHIDSEGGLVHLGSQLGTKCIVLFGPTPEAYYGYEQNDNIKVGDCHECYMLYEEIDKCAKNLQCPACMDFITPELVMNHVDEYFAVKHVNESGRIKN